MNYSKEVANRELCEDLQRLNICQSEPELYWLSREWKQKGLWVIVEEGERPSINEYIIAPTLSRMIAELPEHAVIVKKKLWYQVTSQIWNQFRTDEIIDEHLPNAVAKALIVIKKAEVL